MCEKGDFSGSLTPFVEIVGKLAGPACTFFLRLFSPDYDRRVRYTFKNLLDHKELHDIVSSFHNVEKKTKLSRNSS